MVTRNITLPKDFLEAEVRSGYLVSEQMKKVWAVELDLLAEFDRVCKKYNLPYWADGGTLLGAIRHKGFIPWDDDVDLLMLREDYDRLCQVAPQEFRAPYFWQTDDTDPGFQRSFARLRNSETTALLAYEAGKHYSFNQGIFIDISPLDNVPDSEGAFFRMRALAGLQWKLCRALCNFTVRFSPESVGKLSLPKRLLKYAGHALCRALPGLDYRAAFRRFEGTCMRWAGVKTRRVSVAYYQFQYVFDRRVFDHTIYVNFENRRLPVPEGYAEILRSYYGDYLEKRRDAAYHEVALFDPEKSYTAYI